MQVIFHKYFIKRYKKLTPKIQKKFDAQLTIFYANKYDARLNNHALHGKFASYRSIDVTGDIRAVYKEIETKARRDNVVFADIGSHTELYS